MWKRTLTLAWIVVGALLVGAGFVSAKGGKPPPPVPVDGGVIYYWSELTVWQMDPDGSGKTALFTGQLSMPYEPSAAIHYCGTHGKDERWFLTFQPVGEDEFYPNGIPRHELFAVCEGGTAVQLTSDESLEPDNLGYPVTQFTRARPRWFDGDTQVSYLAKRWQDGEVVEWGIYTLAIEPDVLDDHMVDFPVHVPVALTLLPYVPLGVDRGGVVDAPYDWKPDGSALVFKLRGTGAESNGLYLVEESSGWITYPDHRLTTGDAYEVRWSPTSSRLLFEYGRRIDSMDAYDPSDRTTVIENPFTLKNDLHIFYPCWSPSGTHIVFDYRCWKEPPKGYSDIHRATATGSDETNLTRDTDAGLTTLGWR